MSLERVSKRFTIYRRKTSGLKERLIGAVLQRSEERETLWALRDVSLEIAPAETLAIIGPNGCGKSTLLQVIAGILTPDGGRSRVVGRVTSLLELGAGFSPDLSGRENVFLNASLHGLARAEVEPRFDAIVEFAGLARFIDTPVRNYSSGMYMRLGFAVAVHLDPEILLVDEAFAVGDEAFQRKCLRTLKDFQERGITIVVVSHDLILIEQMASLVCLLQYGQVAALGRPSEAIARYHEIGAADLGTTTEAKRWGSREVEIMDLQFFGADGRRTDVFRTQDAITVRLTYKAPTRVERPVFGIAIFSHAGAHITGPNTRMSGFEIPDVCGEGWLDCRIDSLPLLPGRYLFSASVYDHDLITPFDHRDRFKALTVLEGGTDQRFGLIELPIRWGFPGRGRPEGLSGLEA